MAIAEPAEREKVRQPQARTRFGMWLERPLASFHLIVTIATLLTVLGLVMVLSASSVESYNSDGSAYTDFMSQAMFAVIGAVLFYLALRVPIRFVRKISFPAFLVSVGLLLLVFVPAFGVSGGGARRWIAIGPLPMIQPSEIVKVTLVVWGAHILAMRAGGRRGLKEMFVPLIPWGLFVCFLIVLQPNLSTTIAIGIILAALLWFGGLSVRVFMTCAFTGVGVALALALTEGYRSARVFSFLDPEADKEGSGYQAIQAKYSLADGGLFGRGLGQSRAKWDYLPNAHNDFIFAIIGEELGFMGCLLVIGLFALFVYTGLRIAMRSVDPFLRLLCAAATVWITAQAFINIGYVVGVLPVTGLQLPLVSAGGSSLAITLLMFGVMANAARHEPDAIIALSEGRSGRLSRLLKLPAPQPYRPPVAPRRPGPRPGAGGAPRPRQQQPVGRPGVPGMGVPRAGDPRAGAVQRPRPPAQSQRSGAIRGGSGSHNPIRTPDGRRKPPPPTWGAPPRRTGSQR